MAQQVLDPSPQHRHLWEEKNGGGGGGGGGWWCYIYGLNAGMKSYNGIQVYCKYIIPTTTNIQAGTSIQQFTSKQPF